MIKANL